MKKVKYLRLGENPRPTGPKPEPKPEHPDNVPLRDWFAGQALVGQLSTNPPPAGKLDNVADFEREAMVQATMAYVFANAMLTAREAKP